jgi:hypothetical protein
MKNYYCLIVIGKVEGMENTLTKVIEGKFMHKNLGKLFISTFESNFSIWEIEQILHGERRSYFLTKMQGSNFTATVQDEQIQNDLFLDYVTKMVQLNDNINNDLTNFNIEDPFESKKINPMDFEDKINEFLNNIKNNSDGKNPFKSRKKVKNVEIEPPTLDEILDKINKVGYQKLTKFEKECLENYSKKG